MTNDLWNELTAQVETHGPGAIVFELVDSDNTELVVQDVSWEGEFIKVMMEVDQT